MKNGKVKVWKSRENGRYHGSVTAQNGNELMTTAGGRGYEHKKDAEQALLSAGIILIKSLLVCALCFSLTASAQTNTAPTPPVVVASGPINGNSTGLANFGTDLYNFIAPNSSNGLFNADEFDVDALGMVTHTDSIDKLGKTHTKMDFGADLALSYFFTTGLGSRFDVQYANGQATYTSLAAVARTTFGTSSNLVMISPYVSLIASHGVGDQTGAFNSGIGFGAEIPFHISKVHGRFIAEVDTKSHGQPDYKFGLNFNWQRK